MLENLLYLKLNAINYLYKRAAKFKLWYIFSEPHDPGWTIYISFESSFSDMWAIFKGKISDVFRNFIYWKALWLDFHLYFLRSIRCFPRGALFFEMFSAFDTRWLCGMWILHMQSKADFKAENMSLLRCLREQQAPEQGIFATFYGSSIRLIWENVTRKVKLDIICSLCSGIELGGIP